MTGTTRTTSTNNMKIQSKILTAEEQHHLDAIRAYWQSLNTLPKKVSCINSMWVDTDPVSSCKAIANLFSTMKIHEVLEVFPHIWLKVQARFVATIQQTDMNEFMSLLPYETASRICWQLEVWGEPCVKNFTIYRKFNADLQEAVAEDMTVRSERQRMETLLVASMRDEMIAAVSGLVLDTLDHAISTLDSLNYKTQRMRDKKKSAQMLGIFHQVTNALDTLNLGKTRKALLDTAQMIERNTILKYNAFASTGVWKEYDINGDFVFAVMEDMKSFYADTLRQTTADLQEHFKKSYAPDIATDCILIRAYDSMLSDLCKKIKDYMQTADLDAKAKSINASRIYTEQIQRISTTAGRILSEMQIDRDVVKMKTEETKERISCLAGYMFEKKAEERRKELRRDFLLWYICKYVTGELNKVLGNDPELTHENYFISKVLPYTLKGGLPKPRFMKDVKAIRAFAALNGITTADTLKEALPTSATTLTDGTRFNIPSVSKMLTFYENSFPGPSFKGFNEWYEKFEEAFK